MIKKMHAKLVRLLSSLGLSAAHARAYLSLLALGEGTVLDVARHSRLNRTTLYPVLEELGRRGLVSLSKVGKHTYFLPEHPKDFLRSLRARVDTLTGEIELLELKPKSIHRPRVYVFTGSDGFKQIWKKIFSSGVKEYLIITDPREMAGFVRQRYIVGTIIPEKLRLGIRSRQLIASSNLSQEIIAKDNRENRVSRIIPHQYRMPFTTIIFDDNVAIIPPAVENLITVIESPAYAKAQRALFDLIWDLLPAPQTGSGGYFSASPPSGTTRR